MVKDTSASIYLRFAGASFAAIFLWATAFAYIGINVISSSERQAAARSAASVAGTPLKDLVASQREGDGLASGFAGKADAIAAPLITNDIRAIAVWGPDRRRAYTAGESSDSPGPRLPGGDVGYGGGTAGDGGGLFVTYVNAAPYTIEIAQDAGPLSDNIFHAQRRFVMITGGFAFLLFVLVQGGFRFAVQRFTAGHRRLLYLYTTGDRIRSSLDLHEVVTHLSRDATGLAGGDHGLVALFDETSGDLMLQATYDNKTSTIAHHQKAVEDFLLRRCVATNTTIVSAQPPGGYRPIFAIGIETPLEGQASVLCVPIAVRDRVVGVVATIRLHGRYTPTEVAQVEELSSQAVTAVEQAQLFTKVRAYADEIELSYDATLKALMAALDTKDEVTEGHCERVAKLTIHLAKQMNIPADQLVNIERGALLHDVGKIGVPDAVLRKPKELNDLEWEAMRKHPLLAGLMVSKIGFLEGALPILLYHHERYDGTGYPFGLTADKIPLEARIFSIVDAYDAMTSDRPYRAAMTHEAAMKEVYTNSAIQFDPDVVEAFITLMQTRPELQHRAPQHIEPEYDDHEALPPEIVRRRHKEDAA